MSETNLQRIILDLAVEDSYALSEVVSRVRQSNASLSLTTARELARRTVQEMLHAGLIVVTRLESPNGPEATLDHDTASQALADDLTWLELKHWRPHVRVVATPAGEEAYHQGYTGS
jgi:hypothetical protein